MPEQQVILLPLVVRSFWFPPEVPSLTGRLWRAWFTSPTDAPTMSTLALPDFDGSACETAFTNTPGELGKDEGAVYNPELVIVPTVAFPSGMPFTFQFTAVLDVPVTVAKN